MGSVRTETLHGQHVINRDQGLRVIFIEEKKDVYVSDYVEQQFM